MNQQILMQLLEQNQRMSRNAEHQAQTRNVFQAFLNNNNQSIMYAQAQAQPQAQAHPHANPYLHPYPHPCLMLQYLIKHLILINNNLFINSNIHSIRLLQPQMIC